jgi:hypothetical protein
MEDWQKDLATAIETAADEVEQFFTGLAEALEIVIDEVQTAAIAEIDRQWQEFLEPMLEMYWEIEEETNDSELISYNYPVEPTAEKYPACRGCRHYHGQVYGGNLLVCGMHPYGQEDDHCRDWEGQIDDRDIANGD